MWKIFTNTESEQVMHQHTRVNIQLHFANQDINPAGDRLHYRVRDSLHDDVTVPWYILLPVGNMWKNHSIDIKYLCISNKKVALENLILVLAEIFSVLNITIIIRNTYLRNPSTNRPVRFLLKYHLSR